MTAEQRATVVRLTERACGGSWTEYERLKQRWRDKHPEATPQQYEQAMRSLTTRLGL